MTVANLLEKAECLKNSKFNKGEQILFAVEWGSGFSHHVHTNLFSTPEKAIQFCDRLMGDQKMKVFPVFDIWHNPNQVDLMF